LLRALPGEPGFLATIPDTMRKHRRQVDTSVGVSGPHDFAVRPLITRQLMRVRPSHPAPDVRDDREAPLLVEHGTAETGAFDLPDGTSETFLRERLDMRLDAHLPDLPVGQISLSGRGATFIVALAGAAFATIVALPQPFPIFDPISPADSIQSGAVGAG
jgi:hypothetical protein